MRLLLLANDSFQLPVNIFSSYYRLPAACRGGPKKGRTSPLDFEGLKSPLEVFVNLSISRPETSTLPITGKKAVKRKKAGPPA